MTIQHLFLASIPDLVFVYTSGTGSVTTPLNYTRATVEAIGGGGTGFGAISATNRAGGGGGQYARSNTVTVTGNTTIIYYSVGAAAQDSWANVGANSAPTSATTGCLAKTGGNAASATAGIGNTAGGVGTINFGGNGTAGAGSVGGGGGGATTAGSGQIAGTDTTGYSTDLMGDGTGGAFNTAGSAVAPGGGGGGAQGAGTNLVGASGRVRVRFSRY